MSKPINIVGGGVAGLSLGIALRNQDVPVTLYEALSYPRHRVCGEFICGVSDATLENLGIKKLLADCGRLLDTAWYRGNAHVGTFQLPKPAIAISRYAMDQRLADQFVALGGNLRTNERVSEEVFSNKGWVRASGRRKSNKREWIGLKAHFTGLETTEDLELHIGSAGYVGMSKVENGCTNVSGLFKLNKNCKGQKRELLLSYLRASGLDSLADRLAVADMDAESFCGVTALDFKRYFNSADEFCLGDAQGMICPYTGNGMSIALESAELATEPLMRYAEGVLNWTQAIREYNREASHKFAGRLRASTQLHPFIYQKPFNQLSEGLVKLNLLPFRLIYQLTH